MNNKDERDNTTYRCVFKEGKGGGLLYRRNQHTWGLQNIIGSIDT